mmetsp:Transcript_12652/g.39927  ORF Transcript_12652/g.39927 Transcript_12652/m.39927 type:complete len:247 (+) Transcript_12652:2351-3091(+)
MGCMDLARPASEASEVQSSERRLKLGSFMALSRSTFFEGSSMSAVRKSALLHRVPTIWSFLNEASLTLYHGSAPDSMPRRRARSLVFLAAGVQWMAPSYQQCCTVMRFWVSVPVLSEAITVVEPRVSTASRFLTSTFLACMRLAVRARDTVTVARRPSGTLATMMPMANTTFLMMGVPMTTPMIKKTTPRVMATAEIRVMNFLISLAMGESSLVVSVARPAIWPITVRSPLPTTQPRAWPACTMVV